MRVYLSGPITGQTDERIRSWRQIAAEHLMPIADVIDPALTHYDSVPAFDKNENAEHAIERLRHGLSIVPRNRTLIRSSDVLLANFLGAKQTVSIGSVGEIYWANAFAKFIIIVREAHGNIHDHAMLNAMAGCICHSLDEAFASILEIAEMVKIGPQTA